MENRISFRHVSCFLAIAQERNLGRAAERLHLSQPAVSKTLAELEMLAGVRLVDRGRHGAALTPAGEHFLRYAAGVARAMEAAAGALQGPTAAAVRTLDIGALPTVASGLLPDALIALRAQHPEAGVTLRTAMNDVLFAALKAGHLDCVIGRMADPAAMQGLSFELLYAEPLVMAVQPQHPLLASQAPGSPHAVLDYPLVVAPTGTVPRLNTDAFFDAHALRVPANCVQTLSVSVARLIARRSNAIWITPELGARGAPARGQLAALPLPMLEAQEPVGFIRRSAAEPNELTEALAAILRTLASTHAPAGAGAPRRRKPSDASPAA
jgi:DNA-binding transcriptional LysR family regulator